MTTEEVAAYMLETGKAYTAAQLAAEAGISLSIANNRLWNIRKTHKYRTETGGKPLTTRVMAIGDSEREQRQHGLWTSVLSGRW